jgi:hypothetical protein
VDIKFCTRDGKFQYDTDATDPASCVSGAYLTPFSWRFQPNGIISDNNEDIQVDVNVDSLLSKQQTTGSAPKVASEIPRSKADLDSPPLPRELPKLNINYEQIDYKRFVNDILATLNPYAGWPHSITESEYETDEIVRPKNGAPTVVTLSKRRPDGKNDHLRIIFHDGRPRLLTNRTDPEDRGETADVPGALVSKFESGFYGH